MLFLLCCTIINSHNVVVFLRLWSLLCCIDAYLIALAVLFMVASSLIDCYGWHLKNNCKYNTIANFILKIGYLSSSKILTARRLRIMNQTNDCLAKKSCCFANISFLDATRQLYEGSCPSVSPSVCLSVCLLHRFHDAPREIFVSSWNFQEWLPW